MKTIWIILISIVVAGGLAASGTYYFVKTKNNSHKKNLQTELDNLNKQIAQVNQNQNSNQTNLNTNINTNTNANTNTNSNATFKNTFTHDTNGYHGTLTLTGYIKQTEVPTYASEGDETPSGSVNYVSFVFTKSNSTLFAAYLAENNGNSYASNNSIGLGCYDRMHNGIYSVNDSDAGEVTNNILGADLAALLESTSAKQVNLELEKPIYTSGHGAPACYSHFRNFKIVN